MIGSISRKVIAVSRHKAIYKVAHNSVRNDGTYIYRLKFKKGTVNPFYGHAATTLNAIIWWWVLYHLWHDWRHIVYGDGIAPNPSIWTDEELGIPPEDEENL